MIVVKDLSKEFQLRKRVVKAVDSVSFTAYDGEVFGLLGPNGAGKTTTLRTIATLLQPTKGSISVDGLDVIEHSRAVRDRIGFLTGEMRLTGQLSARELLHYFGQLDRMDETYIAKRMDELAREFELGPYMDTPIAKLSSGITQKVSIAVALINEPHDIIFDEPTSNLDVIASKIVSDFIRQAKDEGKCVLLSTHILSDAHRLCDRIGVMYEGQLLCEGPLEEVLEIHKTNDLETLFFSLVQKKKENSL
ncbi:MAG: ATP-binding cassette domain-containing protein [Sphaerochaetaceae bacterium]|jgi:sodium transport system ATP-binding protein